MNFKEVLHNTLSVQSHTGQTQMMNTYIKRFANKIPGVDIQTDNGNIYISKGEAEVYPCLVSHTDTVHSLEDKFAVLKQDGVYFGWNGQEQCGVGGDDKVGVAMCLWFLQELPAIKVAFFRDEESGCTGSRLADINFFDDVSFVVQCDRKGYGDVVNSIMGVRLFDDDFAESIQHLLTIYNRNITTGMMTDVWKLRTLGLEVASMNLSCGYYNPHSSKEIVHEGHVILTRDFIHDMIEECGHKRWIVSTPTKSPYSLQEYSRNYSIPTSRAVIEIPDDEDDDDPEFSADETCTECGVRGALIWDTVEQEAFCMACQQYLPETDVIPEFEDAYSTY